MFDLLDSTFMLGDRRGGLDAIRSSLTRSGIRERIKAFRLTGSGPRQVTLVSLNDGRKHAASWVEFAEMCNRIVSERNEDNIITRGITGKGDIFRIEPGIGVKPAAPSRWRRLRIAASVFMLTGTIGSFVL